MKLFTTLGFVAYLLLQSISTVQAQNPKPPHAATVSAHPLATQAGQSMITLGGNAFDAAVAMSATLSVVEPYGSGLGGGGFWLIYDADKNEYVMIDAREIAPAKAHATMYLDANGEPIPNASKDGPLAAGIPGVPAALAYISKTFGKLPLDITLAPAIKLAEQGFMVDERYIKGITYKKDLILKNAEATRIFLDNGKVPAIGWTLVQTDLGQTLRAIAQTKAKSFYHGKTAKLMVKDVRQNKGIWSLKDLQSYSVIKREPIIGEYHGTKIITPNLPSSGGLVLTNTLNILSGFDLKTLPAYQKKHIIIEALKRGYQERAEVMGDHDFVDVPSERLLSLSHASEQRKTIKLDEATKSTELSNAQPEFNKGTDTTHFAAIDKNGNRVAVTQSINFWFGSGFVPKGTGVLLNNEMDDFSIKPGVENGYGLIGGRANAIEPHKRMLSSMTPTFLENETGMAIIGTPGGSRIISMVLLATLNWLDGFDALKIVTSPRFHHQFHPDKVFFETDSLTDDEQTELEIMGHMIEETKRPYGNMQVILWNYLNNTIITASDPRGQGSGRVY